MWIATSADEVSARFDAKSLHDANVDCQEGEAQFPNPVA